MRCHLCGANPATESVCLKRVNGLGVVGIWECNPTCGAQLSEEESILLAIQGEPVSTDNNQEK